MKFDDAAVAGALGAAAHARAYRIAGAADGDLGGAPDHQQLSRRSSALAADLVNSAPDALVAVGTPSLAAIQKETHTIPINGKNY
jgi:hypothetical protein